MRVADPDGDGTYEVLFGSSVLNGNGVRKNRVLRYLYSCQIIFVSHTAEEYRKKYHRVNQPFILYGKSGYDYGVLSSNAMVFFSSEGYSKTD